jgi:L-seryl-tRNA(Ser) seleniumtransferase
MDDLGSGALVDLARSGVGDEPTVHESVRAGADVVTFSGDKMLGGPQAGLVLGTPEAIGAMKRHPLMRVLRVDKLTLAALEATLRLYRNPPEALRRIPTLAALTASPDELQARAGRLASLLAGLPLEVSLEEGKSQVGGGSLPGEELPTTLVVIRSAEVEAGELARRLRMGEPSVWGRVRKGALLLDLRTVADAELNEIRGALAGGLGAVKER